MVRILSAFLCSLFLLTSCTTPAPTPVADSTGAPEATENAGETANSPSPPPAPPKPSLAALEDRSRPNLEFFGATIYADAIDPVRLEARGRVFLDGTPLHHASRSFPVAVYADHVQIDPDKEQVRFTGWPIVKTDSAFVQAQAPTTVIELSQTRMARIDGPARYVMGDKGKDLFLP